MSLWFENCLPIANHKVNLRESKTIIKDALFYYDDMGKATFKSGYRLFYKEEIDGWQYVSKPMAHAKKWGWRTIKKGFILLLALISLEAAAAIKVFNFEWVNPTEYTDGTSFPGRDFSHYIIMMTIPNNSEPILYEIDGRRRRTSIAAIAVLGDYEFSISVCSTKESLGQGACSAFSPKKIKTLTIEDILSSATNGSID